MEVGEIVILKKDFEEFWIFFFMEWWIGMVELEVDYMFKMLLMWSGKGEIFFLVSFWEKFFVIFDLRELYFCVVVNYKLVVLLGDYFVVWCNDIFVFEELGVLLKENGCEDELL